MPARRKTPDELAEQLREITAALRTRARTESAQKTIPSGTVSYPQLAVLKRLDAEGPATTADLARAERMTPQSMGTTVAALDSAGYLVRRDDSSHGRRRLVSLSAAGRKALALNRRIRLRWLADVIAEQIDADEQETLAAALAILDRILIS